MRIKKNVHSFDFKTKQEYLLISDLHWDSPECNRDLLKNHLDQAKKRDAKILINGDMFDLMAGINDRRANKDHILPEFKNGRYLDSIVEGAVEWFAPYANHLIWVGYGNHETSIIKHQETDILQRFVDMFNLTHKPERDIEIGAYTGVLIFRAGRNEKNKYAFVMKYHHGYGGGGIVTKGVIQNQRMMASTSGYDVIWMGHVHELYHHVDIHETYDRNKGILKPVNVHHIRTATYKQEATGMGWHVERGAPMKPLGGFWMQLEFIRKATKEHDMAYMYPTFTECSRMY